MFKRLSQGLRDLAGQPPPKIRPPASKTVSGRVRFNRRTGETIISGRLQEGAGASAKHSFLRRIAFGRKKNIQISTGPSELEQRAAQDVQGTLAERIVVQELRRRKIEFDFKQYANGKSLVLYGQKVDFLITDLDPQIALDVFSDYHAPPQGVPYRDLDTALAIEGHGFIYAALFDQLDVFPNPETLELRLDQILMQRATQTLTPNGWGGDGPGGVPWGGNTQDEEKDVVLQARVAALEQNLANAQSLLLTHADRHVGSGPDFPRSVPRAERVVRFMQNTSGGLATRGTPVIISTTTNNTFDQPTSGLQDQIIHGVTDEDIPNNGYGNVVLLGITEVRAVFPTATGKYLRTSSSGTNAEGTASPTLGTFGVALEARNNTTGRALALVGLTPNARTALDIVTTAVLVQNSAVATTIYSFLVPGNTLGTTRRLRLTLFCDAFNNTGVDRTVILQLGYGATTLVVTEAIALVASANTRAVLLEVDLMALGAANSQLASFLTQFSFPNTATTGTGADLDADRMYQGTAAEDSTSQPGNGLYINVTLSAASGSLQFRMKYAILEAL